jgi:hypothetical protein
MCGGWKKPRAGGEDEESTDTTKRKRKRKRKLLTGKRHY